MSISKDGWLVGAVVRHGIPDKVYSEPNKGLGFALHSIEGTIEGAIDRFLRTDKTVDGRYTVYAAASCMFINPKKGILIQMHPITASTWTSGSRSANTTLWAVESEGRVGEPLNANQVANMMYLVSEWEAHTGKRAVRDVEPFSMTKTIWEHNEVSDSPTACPSGRYAPFYAALTNREEDELTPEQAEFLKWAPARLSALEHALIGKTGNEAKAALDKESSSGKTIVGRVAGLETGGDSVARSNINGHIANHARQPGANGIPPHTHKPGDVA